MAQCEVHRRARAIVVDDDLSILLLAARWLLEAGWMVSAASSFDEGLDAIRTHCPDLLLIDVRLGEFNGVHLAMTARQLRADARILLMSGSDDPVVRADANICGASYLCKPFTSAELFAELRQASPTVRPLHRRSRPDVFRVSPR